MGASRRAIALTWLIALVGAGLAAADAAPIPSLELRRTSKVVRFVRASKAARVPLTFGLRVAAVGGDVELRATRAGYADPIETAQVDATDPDSVLRDIPSSLLRDWFFLRDFLVIDVRDRRGNVVRSKRYDVCPNRAQRRVDESAPAGAVYPATCSANPFTLGTVMGIQEGWAIDPGIAQIPLRLDDGRYRVRAAIARRYRSLFGISHDDAVKRFTLVVRTARSAAKVATSAPLGAVTPPPVDTTPDPSTLPDLRAVPAWGIHVRSMPSTAELGFNATEWNAGPAPMVIEGQRIPGTERMQAAQYFYDAAGVAVGQDDDVGELEFHHGDGHNHWHFQQFVTYDLVAGHTPDGSGPLVTTSGKMAWCIVPTDAIDLTVEGATWRPGNSSLSSACGNVSSESIREVLHVGHGDTYNQTVSGQTFDITNVPAGDYQVRIEVNPALEFHEADTTNNVSLRNITIGGPAGGTRTVSVQPVGNVTA